MSTSFSIESKYTCSKCSRNNITVFPIADDAVRPTLTPPYGWVSLTKDFSTAHLCPKCIPESIASLLDQSDDNETTSEV